MLAENKPDDLELTKFIKPVEERTSHGLGRTVLKLAGEGYLTRKIKEAA